MANEDAKVVIGGDARGATDALQQLQAQTRGAISSVKGQFEQLQAMAEKVKGAFLLVTAALAGGKLFGEAVRDTIQMGDELRSLRVVLGISAEAAAGLREALDQIGVSTETYISVVQRLAAHLRAGEDRFNQLGVVTRNSKGELLDMQRVMENSLKTLLSYKEGTDRDLAATEMLGRGWAESSKLLRLNKDAMDAATASALELGLAVGPKEEEQFFRFKKTQAEAKSVMEAMGKAVTEIVLPGLIDLGEWFRHIGPEAVAATHAAMVTFKVTIDALWNGVMEVWAAFKLLVGQLTVLAATLVDVVPKLIRWDWAGAKEAANRGLEQIKDTWNTYLGDIAKLQTDFKARTQRAMDPAGALPDAPATPSGKKKYVDKAAQKIAEEDLAHKIKMVEAGAVIERQFLDAEVTTRRITAEQKIAIERELDQRVYESVRGYMVKQAALYGGRTIEHKKMIDAIEELDAKHLGQEFKNDAERAKQDEAGFKEVAARAAEAIDARVKDAQEGLKVEREYLQQQVDEGEITAAQKLAIERQTMLQVLEYARTEMEAKLSLYRQDSREYQKSLEELAALNGRFNAELQKNSTDAAAEFAKRWTDGIKSVQTAFDTSIKGMIQGTQSLKQGLANIWNSIAMEFLNVMVLKRLNDWMAAEAKQLAVKMGFAAKEKAADTATSTTKAAGAKLEAAAVVPAEAAEAAGGAASAVASIPIVGPELAAAAYAETFAMVMAGLSAVSAAGGYDIPSGANPLVQAHASEMILPASIADPLRESLKGGGGLGDGDLHVHVHAMDSRDVERALSTGGALDKSLKRLRRNWAPSTRT